MPEVEDKGNGNHVNDKPSGAQKPEGLWKIQANHLLPHAQYPGFC